MAGRLLQKESCTTGSGMKGDYFYHNKPYKMNNIGISLLKGSIGGHIAPAGLARTAIQEARIDAKK